MIKKLLLSLVAGVFAISASAQNYVYTPDSRLKVEGEVAGFANTTTTAGWNIISTSEVTVPDVVACENNVFTFQTTTAANGLIYTTAKVDAIGTYVCTFKISNSATTFTSVAGTDAALNRIVFAATSADKGCDVTTVEGDTAVVSTSTFSVNATEQTCAIAITTTKAEQTDLTLILNSLAEGTVVSDIRVVKANAVYDTRNFKKVIDYANLLLGIPEFAAAESTAEFKGTVEVMQGMYDASDADGSLDDEAEAATYIADFQTQQNAWLDQTSEDMASHLTGISQETLIATTKINRGDATAAAKYFPNLQLDGGNWQHGTNADYLFSAIQNGYSNSAVYTAYNTNLPKGKYFFYADVCNANTGKSSTYVYTYNLETVCKKFIGADSVEFTLPATSDYTPVSMVGQITENGGFRAGISWPGTSNGGAFFIKNVAVRFIGSGAEQEITRKSDFETGFMAQYNSAVSARNALVKEITTPTDGLKWGRDSLQKAEVQWKPFLEKPLNNGWISGVHNVAESITYDNDAKVATNEELLGWKVLQGVYTESDTVGMSRTLAEYPIVRGYQYATTYVKNVNQVITDTKTFIENAKTLLEDPQNASGDTNSFLAAIKSAIEKYNGIVQPSTDATMKADSVALVAVQNEINTAISTFKSTATLKPIVNINFDPVADPFDATKTTPAWEKITTVDEETGESTVTGFKIAGVDEVGKAMFTSAQVQQDENGNPENTTNGTLYQLGYAGENEGVLHMGNSSFYVPLKNVDPTNDILKVEYDMYIGNLSGRYFWYTLTNTEDNTLTWGTNTLGGFMYNKYNNATSQNTIFADEDGTLDNDLIYGVSGYGSSSVSNNGICVEANRTHFTIVYNLKTQKVKAAWQTKFTNGIAASSKTGYETAMPVLEDMTPRALVFGTNYSTAARNCWMDNVVVYKYSDVGEGSHYDYPAYKDQVEGQIVQGIANVKAASVSGQAVKALYNGQVVIVKGGHMFTVAGAQMK